MLLVILLLCSVLELMKLHHILTYVIPALSLTAKQIDELNICWNSVVRKVFGYHKWESVNAVSLGLGRLNVEHLIVLRKVSFTDICYMIVIPFCVMCF